VNKETEITIGEDTTVKDVVSQLKEAGINASFDENNGRIFLSSKSTGADGDFKLEAMGGEDSTRLLGLLGLDTSETSAGNKAVKIDGSDAQIVLNGVLYSSTSNNFSINGLSITANAVTDDINDLMEDGKLNLDNLKDTNALSINTSVDTQGIYDTVKDFLTNYNNIINEITELYNADSASGYEPLTDDEKDAMSDTEISKWETKIKDSLLRRDTTLSTLMNSMMNAMSQPITINGTRYSLSSFGIQTLGYLNSVENEQNAYHIDGDEDDENTSGNTDKLMAKISEDPETVIDFMKQLTSNLYTAIDNQMQSTSLRSRYSIYNDKELKTQYSNYTKTISDWEDKVSDKEDYYYSKFSSMETALAKLNSQTSSLSGLLGS
jgi:flagellar hook-associated protein 2